MPATNTKKSPAKTQSKPAVSTKTPGKPVAPGKTPDTGNGPFEDNFDSSLKDLFISELKDIFWAENHLIGAIPKMVDAAKGAELKKALKNHLQETINQAARLETVFQDLGMPALAKKCDAMEGLTISGEHVIENTLPGSFGRETGVISSGIKVEQFEITCYNGLIEMAGQLGLNQAAEVFQKNLAEEIAASEKLSALKSDPSSN